MEEEVLTITKKDFYLVLPSEADMPTILEAFYKQDMITVVDEETGETPQIPVGDPYLVHSTKDYSIDIVGTIYEPTGNMITDAEGVEYPESAPVPGWHVNIRVVGDAVRDVVETIDAQYGVTPTSPHRIWL